MSDAMRLWMTVICYVVFTACGTESDDSQYMSSPQVKIIDRETLPTYEADRLELVPFCARSCEVLSLKSGEKFYCMESGGVWIPVVGTHECELGR